MLTRHDMRSVSGSREIDDALEGVRERLAARRRLWTAEAALVAVALLGTALATFAAPLGGVACAVLGGLGLVSIGTAAHRIGVGRPTREAAARWIEARVRLEQRLVTLIALEGRARSRLWEELVLDNVDHLCRWRALGTGSRLEPIGAGLTATIVVLAVATLGW
jgi:hypothetical protein